MANVCNLAIPFAIHFNFTLGINIHENIALFAYIECLKRLFMKILNIHNSYIGKNTNRKNCIFCRCDIFFMTFIVVIKFRNYCRIAVMLKKLLFLNVGVHYINNVFRFCFLSFMFVMVYFMFQLLNTEFCFLVNSVSPVTAYLVQTTTIYFFRVLICFPKDV